MKLIDWLRDYIIHYVDIFKFLSNRKTGLFREKFLTKSARRFYFVKIRVQNFIDLKIAFFMTLQNILSKFFYLMHVNSKRQLFIDLNINKKFDIEVILYYVNFFLKRLNLIYFHHVMLLNRIFFQSFRYWNRISLLIYWIENCWNNMNIEENQTHCENVYYFDCDLCESWFYFEHNQSNHVVNYVYRQTEFTIDTRFRLYSKIQFEHTSQAWQITYRVWRVFSFNQR